MHFKEHWNRDLNRLDNCHLACEQYAGTHFIKGTFSKEKCKRKKEIQIFTAEVNLKRGSYRLSISVHDSARDVLPVIPRGLWSNRAPTSRLLQTHVTPRVLRHFRFIAGHTV